MNRILAMIAFGGLLALAACGGGSGNQVNTDPIPAQTFQRNPDYRSGHPSLPRLPELRPEDVASAPISYRAFDGTRLHVGKDIAPRYPLIDVGEYWGRQAGLFRGNRHEHTDAGQIVEYLSTISHDKLDRFSAPPTVHIGQAMIFRPNVLRAVQWLNEALPLAWHIRVGEDVPPMSREVPDGSIYIDFGLADQLVGLVPPTAAASAHLYANEDGSRRAAHIYVAPDRVGWHDESDDIFMEKVIVHELLHGLLGGGHVDRQDSRLFPSTIGRQDPTTMLFPIDRQALFAAYARLEPGDTREVMEEKLFGGWSTLGGHLVLQTEFSEAGITRQSINDAGQEPSFLQAWASGEAPDMNLADSPLRGEVTWNGDLIGFRPEFTHDGTGGSYYTVTGVVQIRVDLSTLVGDAVFDQLETWPATVPNAVGTGSPWGDGDLEYDIAVLGNTFHQTGGDDGVLTGIFTGKHHEEAAGTLERQDLTAAFGASRTR